MDDRYNILIELRPPNFGQRLAVELTFDEPYIEAFKPLPKNRELPWEIHDQEQARKQMALRKYVADIVMNKVAQLLAMKDTTNGYPPNVISP